MFCGSKSINCFMRGRVRKAERCTSFATRQRRVPRARPVGKSRQEFYRKANSLYCPNLKSTSFEVLLFYDSKRANCLQILLIKFGQPLLIFKATHLGAFVMFRPGYEPNFFRFPCTFIQEFCLRGRHQIIIPPMN